MLRRERQKLHSRIAEVLCARFPEIASNAPETVAHHYTEAGDHKWAATFWLKAGQQAVKSSAFIEAVAHFQKSLQSLAVPSENEERDRLELQVQQSLGTAFIAAKGFGAAETSEAFERALELSDKIGDISQVCFVLNGLASVHYMRGNFEQACTVSRDLLARASQARNNTAVLMGRRILGMSLFAMGQLLEARSHLEHALALYDQQRHAPLAFAVPFAQDLKATAQVYLGLTLVLLDRIEDGLRNGREALAYAEQLRHPHTICYVLTFLAGCHLVCGRPEAAGPIADRTISVSTEYGFPQWVAGGMLVRGWSAIDSGQVESGMADLRASIDVLEATGTLVWIEFARFLLARALFSSGELGPALELIDDIVAQRNTGGGRWYEAETLRLRGDILRASGRPVGEAETCYKAAIAVAAQQGAQLWAARASNALSFSMAGSG
jgi:tetratricopeptide (TPR) repeat protein